MEKIKLGLDARLFGVNDRGIGRYTESLARALSCKENIQLLMFVRTGTYAESWAKSRNIQYVLVDAKPYSWQEQILLLRALWRTKCDLVHFPHFNIPILYRRPYVVTVHDLILHHFPNRVASTLSSILFWIKYAMYRLVLWNSLRASKYIIAVSKFTAEDILEHYRGVEFKIETVYELPELYVQSDYDNQDKIWYNKYGKYALVVGAAYPHKNLIPLVKAWVRIGVIEQIQLVLVIPDDYFGKRVREIVSTLGLDHRRYGVTVLSPQTDEILSQLYTDSFVVIMPSLFEGVGLSGLESIKYGTRVLCSAESVFPEVYGHSVTYFNALSVEAIEQGVVRALSVPKPVNSPTYPVMTEDSLADNLVEIYERTIS